MKRMRLNLILLFLATALFCIVVSPVFAKIPDINWNPVTRTLKGGATQTKPAFAGYEVGEVAVNEGKNTSQNLLEIAQNLQASGHYRRACNTLLQALERPQLDCKTLIRDQLSAPEVKENFPIQPATLLRATGLRNLGDVLRMLGALKTSQKVLEQSLEIANQLAIPEEISAAHLSLGNTQRALGKRAETFKEKTAPTYYEQALAHYERSLAQSVSDSTQLRAKLNQLSLLVETNSETNLDPLQRQIQTLIEKLPPNLETVYAQIDFAQSLACLNLKTIGKNVQFPQPPIANLCYPKTSAKTLPNQPIKWENIGQLLASAAQQAEKMGDMRSQSYALGNLGEIYEITQQFPHAQQLTKKALSMARSPELSDIAYHWQWQSGRLSIKTQENPQLAINSYTEAFESLKLLRKDLAALNPEIQFNFRDEVEPVYRQFVALLLEPKSGETQPSQSNLVQARQVIEALQLAEIDNFFRDACADVKPEQLDKIIDESKIKTAAIYTIILDRKLAVILKIANQPDLIYSATAQTRIQVESLLQELVTELKRNYPSPRGKELSTQVYDWLIRPLEADLKKNNVKHLVFVADGLLRNIPMAALHDNREYLLDKDYSISLAPGLQLLKSQPLIGEKLKVLGAGVSLEQTIDGETYEQIQNVETELKQIKATLSNASNILINQDFTKQNFLSQFNSAAFSIVHIATHGKFSSNADQTYIVAWNQRLKVADLDNLLRNNNPINSKEVELLILSACETAKGDNRAALGIAGVAVRAGARSTLATLWRADDRLTAILVKEFYQQLISNPNLLKAQALKEAQRKLIQEHPAISPYKWAAYILVGNWQ